ncbi:MAG: ABC transporter permease [Methanothrix sp.]|uniref:ABC transporter permease n=1 Tax=Methanothrix sp. TaxID=90426 RepID=UPI00247BA2A1|nr:ABC transporter permease [Methanothrix sp.]
MDIRRVCVVALRVVRQLKRDRRTIGLITFAPIVLMMLFGYALSGEMSGIQLGIVDLGGHPALRSYLEGVKDFTVLHLGSVSDAERLVYDGRLNGAVVISPSEIRLLLDATSPQIASAIRGAALAGARGELPGSGAAIVERYVYGYDMDMTDTIGPAILGLVVFFFTFINAAVAFVRERSQGTLEKFMVSPLSSTEIVSGYILGFSLFTLLQSTTTLLVVIFVFGVPIRGSPLLLLSIVILLGAGALALGTFFSNFARSEFQVVQFIPMVVIPQIILSGVWWPIQSIPDFVRPVSYILPLTYATDALRAVMLKGSTLMDVLYPDVTALIVFFTLSFASAILVLHREVT